MYFIGAIGFFVTALGIGIGGLLALALKGNKKGVATTYALCAGLILGLICIEIIPESLTLGGWVIFILGCSTGVLVFFLSHKLSHRVIIITDNPRKDLFIHTGLLLTLSISIHNFPMGIAFGSSQNTGISQSILQTLFLHNIPEGIALFTPFFLAGLKLNSMILLTSIVSLPVGVGAIIGFIPGTDHSQLWAYIISLAVGMMTMVTIKEIYAEALKQSSLVFSLLMTGIGALFIGIYVSLI